MPRAALFAVFCFVLQSTLACVNDPLVEESAVTANEDELGNAYELALENSASRVLLERAQRLWEDFRQANCELISARNDEPSAEAAAQCHAFMARERSFELRLLSY